MSFPPLRSERLNGPAPAVNDELSRETRAGLVALVENRVEDGWLAKEFPERCRDGDRNYIYATDTRSLYVRAAAMVPGLERPLYRNEDANDDTVFDLVEFIGRYVAVPTQGIYHSFLDHYALTFDRRAGSSRYRDDVNELLSRGGVLYRMTPELLVERVGPPEVNAAMSALNPDTGDKVLDGLIERGRELYVSRRAEERSHALQCLWGAFERLKTVEVPERGRKRTSADQLLAYIEPSELREIVSQDMATITNMGNGFRVRHHETYVLEVPDGAYDYFVARLANVLLILLDRSGRLDG